MMQFLGGIEIHPFTSENAQTLVFSSAQDCFNTNIRSPRFFVSLCYCALLFFMFKQMQEVICMRHLLLAIKLGHYYQIALVFEVSHQS